MYLLWYLGMVLLISDIYPLYKTVLYVGCRGVGVRSATERLLSLKRRIRSFGNRTEAYNRQGRPDGKMTIRSWAPNDLQYILHLHERRCCSGGLAKEALVSGPMRPEERLGREM